MRNFWTDRTEERVGTIARAISERFRHRASNEVRAFLDSLDFQAALKTEIAATTESVIADLEHEMKLLKAEQGWKFQGFLPTAKEEPCN